MNISYDIAGYCRISVDDELDRDNTSIENQKSIIEDFVKRKFPGSELSFYEDRDRSGYTFEQREGYQKMRPKLLTCEHEILIVKDFSRFARRNSRGLVELEDLRDAGVRIISIGDNIDYPTYDDWTAIQFRFLINEMPVTDTSKKVKSVIKRRQNEGKWICSVPYGYMITNSKTMAFEVDEPAAEVVRMIFELYNEGWGYKKIANHLTDLNIPTPRMREKERIEARGEVCKLKSRPQWSIVTVQGILENDFYIGTLRQGKYTRKKINGSDKRLDENEHIVFENNHEPIIDYRTFAITKEQMKKRTKTNYRGIKKYDNTYSGFLFCGDCGSPLFSMSRKDLAPAYTCGTYHQRGLKGCTSHHTRTDVLDNLLKIYVQKVKENSGGMIKQLEESIKNESNAVSDNVNAIEHLEKQLFEAKDELKALARQRLRDLIKNPDKQEIYEEMYTEMEVDIANKIDGLTNQITLAANKRNTIIRVNRAAKTAFGIFDDILNKDKLEKLDLEIILDKIIVYEDHMEIKLKPDIDKLLTSGKSAVNFNSDDRNSEPAEIVQSSKNRKDKVFIVNVICSGDPLEIYTDRDGEVIFKKYSPIGELGEFASEYAETLAKTSGHPICITDKDSVVAVSGVPKRELTEKKISVDIEKFMEDKSTFICKAGDNKKLNVIEGSEKYTAGVIVPIIAEGDTIGSVVFFSNESSPKMGEVEEKLAQSAAGFLGRHMEQ